MDTLTRPRLIRATTGDLAGHTVCPIDWAKFSDFKARCYAAGVRYGFGNKDPRPGSGVVSFDRIDCSGFVRTLLMYAAGGPQGALAHFPDGSYTQGDWLVAQGFKLTTREALSLKDGHLRVGVHHPDGVDKTGHIILAVNGHSVESYGGHGPGERLLDTRLSSGVTLRELMTVCYVLC